MTLTIPANVVKYVNACKAVTNDYVVAPSLYLGKSVVNFMTPRVREEDENVYAYAAKETVVVVAKAIVMVAAVSLLVAMNKFTFLAAVGGALFVAARFPQVSKKIADLKPLFNGLDSAFTEHVDGFMADERTKNFGAKL